MADPRDARTQDLERLAALVEADCLAAYNRFGVEFFEEHVAEVVRWSRALAPALGADPVIVEAAALLHDLSAVRDFATLATHHLDGARLARELLVTRGWAAREIEAVAQAIETHSFPVGAGDGRPEQVCLSNADVLSHVTRPAYWRFYLREVRRLEPAQAGAWWRGRLERAWSALVPEARAMVRGEHATAMRRLATSA